MHPDYINDGIITDALGRRYEIVSMTRAPEGLMLQRGRPENAGRKNGQEIIITPELSALIEERPKKGGYSTIRALTGLSTDTIRRRIRNDLDLKPMRRDAKAVLANEFDTD